MIISPHLVQCHCIDWKQCICTELRKRVGPRLREIAPALRGSYASGFTQPRAKYFAQLCMYVRVYMCEVAAPHRARTGKQGFGVSVLTNNINHVVRALSNMPLLKVAFFSRLSLSLSSFQTPTKVGIIVKV